MRAFAALGAALDRITSVGCIVLMAAMTVSILLGVFFRYVLQAPLAWPPEAARFMMVAITLLASSLAMRRGQHVGITLFVRRLPRRIQVLVFLAGQLCILLFLAVLLVEGWRLAFIEGPRQVAPTLQLPMTVAFVALPLGAVLMAVQLVQVTARGLARAGVGGSPFEPDEP